MGLALALLGLTTLAVALLIVPLILRGRAAQARDAYNLAVYRDQLAEIERDVDRGIIGPDEAEAAKSEIGRRILALTPGAAPAASSSTPLVVGAVAIILLPFAAGTSARRAWAISRSPRAAPAARQRQRTAIRTPI
jgi:cytochrome c-type biogenesis protein CcmH